MSRIINTYCLFFSNILLERERERERERETYLASFLRSHARNIYNKIIFSKLFSYKSYEIIKLFRKCKTSICFIFWIFCII